MAQTFFMDEEIASRYLLDAVITLVDAKHAHLQLDKQEEAQRQVGFADALFITKSDLVSEADVADLRHRLLHMNPRAPIRLVNFGEAPIDTIFDLRGFNLNAKLEIDPEFLRAEDHDHDHDHEHGHEHGEHCGDDCGHDHDHDDHDHDHDHDNDHDASHDHAAGGHHHHHGDHDPHAWQSLKNGVVYARNIAEGLAAADPAHAAAYRQRAQAYIARIEALDAQIRKTFASIPAERRQVVSSHDAFGYFGDAYGVRFIPVAGLSTDAEPSAADMARIIEQVKREHVPAVFVENVSSPVLVQQIARETGARTGGTLYSDALAPSGQPAATYLGMFEWNARQLSEALQP